MCLDYSDNVEKEERLPSVPDVLPGKTYTTTVFYTFSLLLTRSLSSFPHFDSPALSNLRMMGEVYPQGVCHFHYPLIDIDQPRYQSGRKVQKEIRTVDRRVILSTSHKGFFLKESTVVLKRGWQKRVTNRASSHAAASPFHPSLRHVPP